MSGRNKVRYQFNYNRLKGRIRERYQTQEKFADALGIGRVSLSQRLGNKLEFTQDEIFRACYLLDIDFSEAWDFFFSDVYVKAQWN
ncbi:MAG: DUF739 family protein [Clostridium sp.]|nr:DUF739 family protein [Clostridium sp.]